MRRLSAERQAAAVVVNVENGDILALASTPSFDPNAFVGGLSAQAWKALVADPDRPMLNKAIGGEYAPGSTFKMTVALAGLDDGVVGPDHTVYCPGYYRLGDSIFHCWKRSEEHTSELQSLMRISYAVFCLKKKNNNRY